MKKRVLLAFMLMAGWVSVASASTVAYTACPANKQLYPRDLDTGTAAVPVSGTVSGVGPSEIVVRIWRDGALYSETRQALVFSGDVAPFSLAPTIEAVLKNHTVDVVLVQGGETLAKQVTEVVAGDVFIITGQSNADAQKEAGSADPNVNMNAFIRTFGRNWDDAAETASDLDWKQARGDGSLYNAAGGIGGWGLRAGRLLVEENNVPVAIINGARGARAIGYFQRNDANPTDLDTNYGRLLSRMVWAGLDDRVRAVLWYQGESDLGDGESHEAGFISLYNDWKIDYPSLERIYIHQLHVGCGVDKDDVDLRDRQRRLPDTFSDMRVMSTNGNDGHEGCHYTYANGHERIGNNIAALVSAELYGSANTANTTAPNPSYMYFSKPTFDEITIIMREPADPLGFDAAAIRDFVLYGTSATVVSGTISPTNSIVLTLSGDASDAAGLAYTGHDGADSSYADGIWVTNAAGVGLLSFFDAIYRKPVLPPANLGASALNSDWVRLFWDASPPADAYVVKRDGVQIAATPSLQYIDTGLAPSTTYQYEVATSNFLGLSSFAGVSATTLAEATAAPSAPTGLGARLLESVPSASLEWNPVAHATGYRVRRNGVVVGTTSAFETSFIDNGLVPGATPHAYDVQAENAIGSSAYSAPAGGFFSSAQLVLNGSFESEAPGKSVVIGSTSVIDSTTFTGWRVFSVGSPPIAGFSVASVANASDWGVALQMDMTYTGSAVGFDYGIDLDGNEIPVTYGQNYLLSFDAARIAGTVNLLLGMMEYDSSGAIINNSIRNYFFPVSSTEYRNFVQEWTPSSPSVATVYFRFVPQLGAGSSLSMLLDNVQFARRKEPATVALGDLLQTYDGSAKTVSYTTDPPGLAVDLAYDGSPTAPVDPGSYAVAGTVNDAIYQGGATNTLEIRMPAAYGEWSAVWFSPEQQAEPAVSGPGIDYDTDGFSNWEEYIAYTDPTDGQAVPEFQMRSEPAAPDGHLHIINWDSVSGRVYSIDWSPDLLQPFVPLQSNVPWPQSSYTDQIHQAAAEGFYRMGISMRGIITNATISPLDSGTGLTGVQGVDGDAFDGVAITSHSALHPYTIGEGEDGSGWFAVGDPGDILFEDVAGTKFIEFNTTGLLVLTNLVVRLHGDEPDGVNRTIGNIKFYASTSVAPVWSAENQVLDIAVNPDYLAGYGYPLIGVDVDLPFVEGQYFRMEFEQLLNGARIREIDAFAE